MKNLNLYQYCLQLGDTSFILSHRIAEYCSKAPHLEEDLAITNVGLDLLGQAESFLKYAAEIKGDGTTEDDLVFKRKEKEHLCKCKMHLPVSRSKRHASTRSEWPWRRFCRSDVEALATNPEIDPGVSRIPENSKIGHILLRFAEYIFFVVLGV